MPSAKVLESKKARVEELTDLIKGAAAGSSDVIMVTLGTGVGGGIIVDGKIVTGHHGAGGEIGHANDVLEGTTAIALSTEDQTAPARILGKYIEGADEKSTFSMKAGFIGTEIYDKAGVTALSKIPSKEVLLAQLLGSLQSPLQKFAATVQAVADKKKEEEVA